MNDPFSLHPNLTALLPVIPPDSIVSRTVLDNGGLKVVLFGFAAGQELSEHTAAYPAILHFLSGKATLTLGETITAATAGTWVHMPARLPHSISAESELKMLLLLLKNSA
ncbi:MAG: cupin domain-containing protein [Anaerolineae bacterium]